MEMGSWAPDIRIQTRFSKKDSPHLFQSIRDHLLNGSTAEQTLHSLRIDGVKFPSDMLPLSQKSLRIDSKDADGLPTDNPALANEYWVVLEFHRTLAGH